VAEKFQIFNVLDPISSIKMRLVAFYLYLAVGGIYLPAVVHLFANAADGACPSPASAIKSRPDCAAASQKITSMTLKTAQVYHSVSANAHMRCTFNIANPGAGEEYGIRGMPFNDDSEWHDCQAGTDPVPKQLAGCRYINDIFVEMPLSFQLLWYCWDKAVEEA
jgi:hypothetical protein